MIDIAHAGVPDAASDIVVFAKIRSGNTLNDKKDSILNVRLLDVNGNKQDERDLFYRTFSQSAWSFNSENMVFPIQSDSKSIRAKLEGTFPSKNFAATVRVYGYYIFSCN